MSGNGASNGEMAFRDLNFQEDQTLATFALAVKAELRATPDAAITRNVVPELAAAAATGERAAARSAQAAPTRVVALPRRRPRFALAARIAFAVALLPALFAGMAVAGVSLPQVAQDAFDAVGVELPNQDSDGTAGGDGEPGNTRDIEPGGTGAGAGQDKLNPARIHGRGNGEQGRGRALGKRDLAPGQLKDKGGNGNKGGNGKSNAGGNGNGNGNGNSGTPPGQSKPKPVKPSPPPAKPVVPPGQAKKDGAQPNATGGGGESGGGNGGGGGAAKKALSLVGQALPD